jgi:hypothetical protein
LAIVTDYPPARHGTEGRVLEVQSNACAIGRTGASWNDFVVHQYDAHSLQPS